MKQRLQRACRSALRPLAGLARQLLTPPPTPVRFGWQRIEQGPAAGTEALLPEGSAIAQAITSGSYERNITAILRSLIAPGDTCFDIGGHYGYYTLVLAKLAAEGQVHTFEPVPDHADRIRQAVSRSGLNHVTVHPMAVAGETGRMTLRLAESAVGDDSMAYLEAYGGVDTPAAKEHYQRFSRITVDAVTLDSRISQSAPPTFIKIDAEGAEAQILRGGGELIQWARPRLLVELHGIYEALQCAEILDAAGYRALLLTDQKITMPILWTPRDDHQAVRILRAALGRDPIVLFDRAVSEFDPTAARGEDLRT